MKSKPHQHLSIALLTSCILLANPSFAGNGPSAASANSSALLSLAVGSVVVGSAQTLSETGKFSVQSIEKVGDSTILVLKDISTGITVSIKTVGASVGAASVGIGTIITVVTEASGYVILASGKIIAFIPNEVGKSLIHSNKSLERGVQS